MLAYQIRIALKSLRRTPVLSLLLIGGIGLGIAVSTAFVTTYYIMAQNPIPEKSDPATGTSTTFLGTRSAIDPLALAMPRLPAIRL